MKPDRLEFLASRKKRIGLVFLLAGLVVLVSCTSTFMSVRFLIYTAVPLWAMGHVLASIFSKKPVLVLTSEGILSNMTMDGRKAGLVPWKDVTEIRETKTFWFIRSVEIYTRERKDKFRLHLAADETVTDHIHLLNALNEYWTKYR